jgi:NitT/TauT family transport system permease protein
MIICLGVFFQLVLMVADAVAYVPEAYYDIAHSVGATSRQRLFYFIIPAAAPEIWDSLRINFGLAWATLIFAEILGATSGLGYLIVRSQRFLLTESIFVAVLVIGVLGIITDRLFEWYYHRWFPWSVQAQRAETYQ